MPVICQHPGGGDRQPAPITPLRVAFAFICPYCSAKQYVDSVPYEFDAESLAALNEQRRNDPEQLGPTDYVTTPSQVQCNTCGKEADVLDPQQGVC